MNTPSEDNSFPSNGREPWDIPIADSTTGNESEDTESSQTIQPTEPEQNIIAIEFIDLNLDPIVGLKYRMEYDKESISGKTDETGNTLALHDVSPGTLIDIYVFRDHLKDYKQVGTICATGGECGFSVVSPKLRFALDTEPHVGTPGNAEDNKPPVPPTIETIAASAAPTPAPTALKPSAPVAAAPATLPPAKPPVAGASTPTKKTPVKLEPGRDKAGNPLLTVKPSTLDNVFKAISPMYHIWGWWSSRRSQPAHVAPPKKPATGNKSMVSKTKQSKPILQVTEIAPHQAINPAANLSQAKGEPLSDKNKKHLDALFKYAEAQALIDYKEFKGGGAVTQKIILATKSDPPRQFPEKKATDTRGMCFAYVRAALHENRFVNADSGNAHAKDAGIDLLKEGYKNITADLPQVSIEYPSGHSAAQYEKNGEIEAKRSIVITKAKAEKWDAEKKKAALGNHPQN